MTPVFCTGTLMFTLGTGKRPFPFGCTHWLGRGRFDDREAQPRFLARLLDKSAYFEANRWKVLPEKHSFGIGERLDNKVNSILVKNKTFLFSQGRKLTIY